MNAAVELANVAPVAASDALVSRITAVRLSLRPSEQRVAAYVLGQPNRVAHMAIAELAEAVALLLDQCRMAVRALEPAI